MKSKLVLLVVLWTSSRMAQTTTLYAGGILKNDPVRADS
jgi:hypothetical protein